MGVTSGFYDSLNHDRQYTAEQFGSIFEGLLSDGIYQHVTEAFQVTPTTPQPSMAVNVGRGRAWYKHTWTLNDEIKSITVPTAPVSGTGNRIDAIVIEIDKSVNVRENSIKLIQGTPRSNPEKPEMADTETLSQYPLAYITVNSGTTAITEDMIEDVRETEAHMVKAIVAVEASDAQIDAILARLDALEAAVSNYWTKTQLQFTTADSGTTLNITVNE